MIFNDTVGKRMISIDNRGFGERFAVIFTGYRGAQPWAGEFGS